MPRTLSIVGLAIATALLVAMAPQEEHASLPDVKHPQLDMIKGLQGTWVEFDDAGQPTMKKTVYRTTAGGSAVIETIMPGAEHEMITMYHLDGDVLMLTHYCALQNQPQMRTVPDKGDNTIIFEFAGGTNIPSPAAMHMHEATMRFIDKDHYEAKWTLYVDGKPSHTETFTMTRVE